MPEPLEIITAPFDVYIADVGTAFPVIDVAPSASWSLLGRNGKRNYSEAGVVVSHPQTINLLRVYGSTGPVGGARVSEDLTVAFTLLDMRTSQYTRAIHNRAEAAVTPQAGLAGTKSIQLYRGTSVYEVAMLVRGQVASPELEGAQAQYEIPRVIQTGAPAPAFVKGAGAGLAFVFTALIDPDANTEADSFGVFRVKYAQDRRQFGIAESKRVRFAEFERIAQRKRVAELFHFGFSEHIRWKQLPETRIIVEHARSLREEARSHKRASSYHRVQARLAMQRYAQLETRLRALGIKLELEGEGENHGRSESTAVST